MLRGVHLGDSFRTARLVRAYYDEKSEDMARTMALIYASFQNAEVSERVRDLSKLLFPDGKEIEDLHEKAKRTFDELEDHFSQTLFVRPEGEYQD